MCLQKLVAKAPAQVAPPWLSVLKQPRCLTAEQLIIMAKVAKTLAERSALAATQARQRSYLEWLDHCLEHSSTGGLHAVAKVPMGARLSGQVGGQACTLQEEADQLAVEWGKWWQAGTAQKVLAWPADLGLRPPRPTTSHMRKVLATFKALSGSGLDSWTPRQLLMLDDQGIDCLIDVIMLIEQSCQWPDMCTKLVFLAKRTGGLRPIALINLIARVQARLRRPIACQWEHDHDREYWWASKGKSCQRAVWQQSAWSEWATFKQEVDGGQERWASAQVLLDLVKAFEQIKHDVLLEAAIKYDFPLWQLKLQVELFRAPRWLAIGQCFAPPVVAHQAILPGDGWATSLLKLALLGPLMPRGMCIGRCPWQWWWTT